ncbi:hypothetical protein [Paenilisteria rocourtiae]|uniref:Uncharacterized protein n=1 Tax=Listeria rocourtiae TaxID=647910 RepID=A0A4R6ZU30_9LIST|nr:hypothetical protein [Listeria rocourtiae]EUJ47217.1 hypothetical protein PROCOU_10356 [Listeria rocourtiae FSL F6-920]MBC1435368.1 hypothetical protein [Listeria rocourtiae]MBC1605713.1 hypothetical protein [Listeria rocourtiae]TDR55764.1 hypothetical protein DFP96_101708 [Listeria rocourtiae]
MDSIFANIGDWFGTAIVIIGILFGLISYFKKAETEKEKDEKSNLPNVPKQRSTSKKSPAKKPQTSGYKDTLIKDAISNADPNVTRMHHRHMATKKRVRGKMQEAIIMKEILDKPVSMRPPK